MDIGEIYERNGPEVYRFLLRLSGNPTLSEDITQTTFLKAIEHIDSFKEQCSLKTWLCQIAKNEYLNTLKKVKRKMRKNQWIIRILVLLLIVLVGKLAMMTYGQLNPGTFTNFEMLTERHQVRKVLDQMCRGNFEPFLECIDYNPEEYTLVVAEDGESNHNRAAGEIMQASVEKVFRGKEIELADDVEVNYVWINGENTRCELVIEANVLVDGEMLEFSFTQKGNGTGIGKTV